MCVCLFVCFLSATRHLSTLRRCLRVAKSRSRRRGRPRRARASMHSESTRSRMPYNFSTKKSYADAFQKQNRTRAHAVVYVTAEIFKKGKKKTNMPLPKFSLQFAFSWSVYFSNRTESYSSFSYLILSKTIGRKRLRTLVGADLGQLVISTM